ncbi:hypothetical protein LZ30DRAFT_686485 [Colletotrichum cereale]|nr:hypothetical protein LZ30DRAFT_686485 [Colletotrichum cereale]
MNRRPTLRTAAGTTTGAITYSTSTSFHDYEVVTPWVTITVVEDASVSCERYYECDTTLDSNPDISGYGVIIAFLISSYLVLGLVLWAYWYGVLPQDTVRRVDRHLFFARQKQLDHRGRRILEEVILIFSDQQLITGIGILIGGYVQATRDGLSQHHWNKVIYLAWVSLTVHLMSLSVLRGRLKRNMVSRGIRVIAVTLVFTLLIAALVPTTTNGWAGKYPSMGRLSPATPVRCLWDAGRSFSDLSLYYNSESVISYLILVYVFVWKLSHFFDTTRKPIYISGRAQVECRFERLARQMLQTQPHSLLKKAGCKIVIAIYINV